jgi:uncharacterized membrane protein
MAGTKRLSNSAGAVKPSTARLFLLIRKMTTHKVFADLEGAGGEPMSTSFDETQEVVRWLQHYSSSWPGGR